MRKTNFLGIVILLLGIVCIGAYFVVGDKFGEVTVSFDSNGGSNVVSQVLKNGEKASEPEKPTKENSEFVEWQLNGVKYNFENTVTSNITLIAKWNAIKEYEIKVTLGDNEYTTKVREGEKLSLESLNIPIQEGYRIHLINEQGEEFDLSTEINSDILLNGNYVEIKKYTVTFNSNGGSKVNNVTVEENKTVDEPSVTRDGYTLDGWYLNNQKYDFSTSVSGNITLKANWIEKGKINVIFKVDDKEYKTISVKENSKVTKPANPTKKGYKFVEWQLNGNAFDFNTKITEEITLTAKFDEISSYKVKFDSNGGTAVKEQDVAVGKSAVKPTNPTRDGYNFIEWQLNDKTYNFNSEVTSDITLKAKWEANVKSYTVTFNSNGGNNIPNQTVKEGNKVTKPTDPIKDGYVFEGWVYNSKIYDFNTAVTGDITLNARFHEQAKYVVTFDTDGGSTISPQSVNEGGKAIRPATNLTKDGFTFKAWQLNGTTYDFNNKVSGNIVLKAKWNEVTPSPAQNQSATETNTGDANTSSEEK